MNKKVQMIMLFGGVFLTIALMVGSVFFAYQSKKETQTRSSAHEDSAIQLAGPDDVPPDSSVQNNEVVPPPTPEPMMPME